jgi:GntR family transcriptional regulator
MMSIKHYIEILSKYRNSIREDIKLPIYYQVELVIENFIENENIESGAPFFSETEVAEQLQVSRPTVNKAFTNVTEKGLLIKKRGKRCIVSDKKNIPLVFLGELTSFGEMLKKQGVEYKTVLLERGKKKVKTKIEKALKLVPGEEVVYLKRLRYVRGEPVLIVDSYMPYARYSKLLEIPEEDFSMDLFKIVKNLFGVSITQSSREVTATNMSIQDAILLNEEIWSPCLRLVAVNYTQGNEPFEYFDSRLSGRKCVLSTSLNQKK